MTLTIARSSAGISPGARPPINYLNRGNAVNLWRLESTSTQESPSNGAGAPDHVISANYTGDNLVSLRFSDGFTAVVDLARLGLDLQSLRLYTICASSWGSSIEVEDVEGETVHIDSAVLRAYSDPNFAAHLERSIAAVTQSRGRN